MNDIFLHFNDLTNENCVSLLNERKWLKNDSNAKTDLNIHMPQVSNIKSISNVEYDATL